MAIEVRLGKLSPTMETGTVVRWLKQEGEAVASGDVVAEVETDKAAMPLEVFEDGTLLKIVAPAGTTVNVDALVAVLGKPGEDVSSIVASAPAPAAPVKPPPPTSPLPSREGVGGGLGATAGLPAVPPRAKTAVAVREPDEGPPLPEGERLKVSPVAKKIAEERGIDLRTLQPTGPGGRIVERDVQAAQAGAARPKAAVVPAAGGGVDVPLSNLRQTIARRLTESKQTIPHWYLYADVLMDRAMQFREELNAQVPEGGAKISVTDIIIKIAAVALARHPEMNAMFAEGKIHRHAAVSIAVAVATEDGLYTPVLRNADRMGLQAIAAGVKELARKTRERRLKPEDFGGSSFTITNLGMFGVDHFFAIINPPEAAILAVGGVKPRPVVNSVGQIAAAKLMTLTLSCDHRVVDGVVGAKFLATIKELLEQPAKLLL